MITYLLLAVISFGLTSISISSIFLIPEYAGKETISAAPLRSTAEILFLENAEAISSNWLSIRIFLASMFLSIYFDSTLNGLNALVKNL